MSYELKDFYQKHNNETCLIVGVGPNLDLTPPQWFNYPSFGVNTIYKALELGKFNGWKPTYYVGVDERLRLEDGLEICRVYPEIPKFFPSPDWDDLQGENIYRFKHRTQGDLTIGGKSANQKDALTKDGINYRRIMDAVFQIAWHMGFSTVLMIGVQHAPYNERDADRAHFWGIDTKAVSNQPTTWWYDGYKHFSRSMGNVKVLNISEDTYVPDEVLPRGNWRDWKNT